MIPDFANFGDRSFLVLLRVDSAKSGRSNGSTGALAAVQPANW